MKIRTLIALVAALIMGNADAMHEFKSQPAMSSQSFMSIAPKSNFAHIEFILNLKSGTRYEYQLLKSIGHNTQLKNEFISTERPRIISQLTNFLQHPSYDTLSHLSDNLKLDTQHALVNEVLEQVMCQIEAIHFDPDLNQAQKTLALKDVIADALSLLSFDRNDYVEQLRKIPELKDIYTRESTLTGRILGGFTYRYKTRYTWRTKINYAHEDIQSCIQETAIGKKEWVEHFAKSRANGIRNLTIRKAPRHEIEKAEQTYCVINSLANEKTTRDYHRIRTGTLEQAEALVNQYYQASLKTFDGSDVTIRTSCGSQAPSHFNRSLETNYRTAKAILEDRLDYQQKLRQQEAQTSSSSTSSPSQTCDMVLTHATPTCNISPEVDARISTALSELSGQYSDFGEHTKAIKTILDELKKKGLLEPSLDVTHEAIRHGIIHLLMEFVPSNPLENKAAFIENALKYTISATFHVMTNGVFLGAEKMATVGAQLHNLLKQDFAHLTPQQRAEFIAEQTADIIKALLADQAGRRILPKTNLQTLPQPSLVPETANKAITPEGINFNQGQENTCNGPKHNSKILAENTIREKIALNKTALEDLELRVTTLCKNLSNARPGEKISNDITYDKFLKIDEETLSFYNKIRTSSEDIIAISNNTGIPKNVIEKIKHHVFIEEHILYDGIGRFAHDADMAAAWQRLINNDFVRSDLLMLQHEYAEALIMNGREIPYREAHGFVNTIYNWKDSL